MGVPLLGLPKSIYYNMYTNSQMLNGPLNDFKLEKPAILFVLSV